MLAALTLLCGCTEPQATPSRETAQRQEEWDDMISRQQLTACVLAVAAKTLEPEPNLNALDGKRCDDPAVGAVGADYRRPPAETLIRIEPTRFVVVLRDSRGKVARYAQSWGQTPEEELR